MLVAFAGSRRNVGLGRSVVLAAGLVPMQAVAPMTAGCPLEERRRGTSSACAQAHALVASQQAVKGLRSAPGHVLHSVQRPVHVYRHSNPVHVKACGGGAVVSVSRSGKPAQAGGTGTGVETDGRKARLAARRRWSTWWKPTRSGRAWRVRKGRWSWPSSLRGNESPGEVSVRRVSCRSRQAASWPRISSHAALQKEWRYEWTEA